MVTHEVKRPDELGNLPVHVFQEGDAFLLPLAFVILFIDPAGIGIESGIEVEGAAAHSLVLVPVGKVLRLAGSGPDLGVATGMFSRAARGPSRLRRVDARRGRSVRRRWHNIRHPVVAWDAAREMMAPGFQLMRGQAVADGRRRDVLDERPR
jgi:hypothetical protein